MLDRDYCDHADTMCESRDSYVYDIRPDDERPCCAQCRLLAVNRSWDTEWPTADREPRVSEDMVDHPALAGILCGDN